MYCFTPTGRVVVLQVEVALEPDEYVERDWAAEEWSRGCYGGRFGSPWTVSTGQAQRPRRCGMATWTERYAPANEPPAKCSSLENRSSQDLRDDDLRQVPRGRFGSNDPTS